MGRATILGRESPAAQPTECTVGSPPPNEQEEEEEPSLSSRQNKPPMSLSSQSQIGYLVPLKANLEEDTSFPRLPIANGSNSVGRNEVAFADKRLSRNHLTLTASPDGSALLSVEGTNPVVVNSGKVRKKLARGETAPVAYGDTIELIPGHHFFKFLAPPTSPSRKKRDSIDGEETVKDDRVDGKRLRGEGEGEASERSKAGEGKRCGAERSEEEEIRTFRVSDEELPGTFRLLRVQGLPGWANTSCVSITDVIQGDILVAILSNYMVDMDWLLSACPMLKKVPHVMVVHGEGDGSLELMKRSKPANWILHKPPLPISFGTHHSKAMILVYPRGVRIIVHTANLIHVDWNNKTQGLWMQDFPLKDEASPFQESGFGSDLTDYLNALKWPQFSAKLPSLGNVNITPSFFKKFDYSSAVVRLIGSVPGYHTGVNLKKWGHMKLRNVLQDCTFDREFKKSPLVYQFSSLGSLDEKWMTELATSMSSGYADDKTPLGTGDPLIIWPTVEDVRCSLEGYAAGNAIPSPLKNVEKKLLQKYWAKWKATHTGRGRAMPHIKTFARYNGQKLAWFLLTSSNLSKAAWGALQKNNSQLMIRSYELGVLFLPSVKNHASTFSCIDDASSSKEKRQPLVDRDERSNLVTLKWQGKTDSTSASAVIPLPVPYELPPQPYTSEDVPWSWDRRYTKKDVYGQVWPRHVQLYASQDS